MMTEDLLTSSRRVRAAARTLRARLGPSRLETFGAALRARYDDTLEEGVPAELGRLLDRFGAKGREPER